MTHEEQWADTEKGLRALLARADCTPEAIDWILADLRPRWLEMMAATPNVRLPAFPGLEPQVTEIMQRNALICLTQMVRLERELYEAKFGCSVVRAERQAELAAALMPPEAGARGN